MHCPKCGAEDTVVVSRGLVARLGEGFSLAGNQFKLSAREVAIATCTACDLHLVGHLETSADPEAGMYFVVNEQLTRESGPPLAGEADRPEAG
jgi:hypothetical protein